MYSTTESPFQRKDSDPDTARHYDGLEIYDRYDIPVGKMIYPNDDLESTQADSGQTYNCVAFQLIV